MKPIPFTTLWIVLTALLAADTGRSAPPAVGACVSPPVFVDDDRHPVPVDPPPPNRDRVIAAPAMNPNLFGD
jgi:hypothetical protein